ncbi:MAG: protein-(glutamine-N5) methyltransferase, release factor-specific [Acidocella sp. 20-57-95]|nr:MAG: protein-(glutamine-N5) methyltransferase, release factor-specific [Acidocella sp. 20-57-95]OYV61642.1 MAG: protein-(glutamine-N5) methyltransferase, release factor-specific [Acidocella sp. 21-58-7]HQT64711.1 peptide chain release factor N(5)-glutamine methyltransferase [Acidocella sp.]HQU03523.1 peptide chain release factor N(5)-glutamine methyltransferase [Acidocella sp.]
MKTADAVTHVAARLAAVGIEDARREARIILAAALQTDAAGLLISDNIDEAAFEPLLKRREVREPLAYILGQREFWGLDFATSPVTLIPRPDSETLIEAALTAFPDKHIVRRVLDLGTGTGCLLVAALHEFPEAFGVGVDLSPEAAALAQQNAQNLGVRRRAAFITADWAAALTGTFELIFSNPPYIPAPDLERLMPEVRDYEPARALDGGADGLIAYRAIISALPALLAPGGVAVLELGVGQLAGVAALATKAGLESAARPDLAGHPRALIIRAK